MTEVHRARSSDVHARSTKQFTTSSILRTGAHSKRDFSLSDDGDDRDSAGGGHVTTDSASLRMMTSVFEDDAVADSIACVCLFVFDRTHSDELLMKVERRPRQCDRQWSDIWKCQAQTEAT